MQKWTSVAVIALFYILAFSIPSIVCAQQNTRPEIDFSDLRSYFFVGQQQLEQSTLRFKLRAKTRIAGTIYMYKYYTGGDWFDREPVDVSRQSQISSGCGYGPKGCLVWQQEEEGSVSIALSDNPSRVRFVFEKMSYP